MSSSDRVAALHSTCESITGRRRLELIDLKLRREAGRRVLRVIVDGIDRAVSVDEIAGVSEEISKALDADDPVQDRYTLEVSSPGIERPLLRPADYRRFLEHPVQVRCFEPIEGRRKFVGRLRSAGADSFVLEAGGDVVEIPYVAVARARLSVDWAEELRGGGPR
ncbi:MAG: ribosome maturation factor RimP [Candidatus Methylomirabilales bacterium]